MRRVIAFQQGIVAKNNDVFFNQRRDSPKSFAYLSVCRGENRRHIGRHVGLSIIEGSSSPRATKNKTDN